jgi:hypothetical protein
MIRWKWAVSLGLMLGCAGTASAWDRDAVQLHVTAGVTARASAHDYNSPARLASQAPTFGAGVSIRLRPTLGASIDVDHTRFGAALAPAWAPEDFPMADESSMTTALLGLEGRAHTADGSGPYLSAALGAGRLSIGRVRVFMTNGGSVDYAAIHETGPAFALGGGIRTPRLFGGPVLQIGVRSVSLLRRNHWPGIIPVTAGIAF